MYSFWSGKNVLPWKNCCRSLLAAKVSDSLLSGSIENIYCPSFSLTALELGATPPIVALALLAQVSEARDN